MQHYLHLCKQELGRRILMLVLLVCASSGAWAQLKPKDVYYLPNGTVTTKNTTRALKYTVLYVAGNTYRITACEPVRESDFMQDGKLVPCAVTINAKIGWEDNPLATTGLKLQIAAKVFNSTFWQKGLESITLPETISYLAESFVGQGNTALKTIDFTSCRNFSEVTFDDYAFGYLAGYTDPFHDTYSDPHFLFTDHYQGVSYSVRMYDSSMTVTSVPSTLDSRVVLWGSKTFGNLTGQLTSLGGKFKGYTKNEFSLAVTDGIKGIEDGALQGSSVVAVSLPRTFDMLSNDGYGASTADAFVKAKCGSDVFTGCDKLKHIYIFYGGVPYHIVPDGSSFTAYYDLELPVSDLTLPEGYGDFIWNSNYSDQRAYGNILFTQRKPQVSGKIKLAPNFEFATGFSATFSDGSGYCDAGKGQMFTGNTNITAVDVVGDKVNDANFDDLAKDCFNGCTGIKEVKMESAEDVEHKLVLRDGSFEGCTSLKKVELGGCVSQLNGNCFKGCTALTDVTFGKSVNNDLLLYGNCFGGCTALQNVTFGKKTEKKLYLYANCFNGCTALTTLNFIEKNELASSDDFVAGSGINTIFFTEEFTVDNSYGWRNYIWTTLNSISIDVKGYSYRYKGSTVCDGMPDGEKMILIGGGGGASSTTYNLSDTNGEVSFKSNSGIKIVSGPLRRVLDNSLQHYSYVELPYGVDFGNNCFDRTKLTHLGLYPTQGVHVTPTYPKEDMATASGKNFFFTVDRCDADVENIIIPSEVMASNVDGVVMFVGDDTKKIPVLAKKSLWGNAENTTLKSVTFAKSSTVGDYVLNIKSNYVPTICAYAFSNCKNLATVKFPTYAFDVEWYAFNDCASLTSVDLRHCRKLSYNAFYNCPSIGAVRFGDQLIEMKDDIFSGDEGKLNTTLKSIVMPQFTLFGDGAWTPTYSAKAFSNLANVKTVVIDPDVSAKNCVSSFEGWKTTLGELKDNGLKVYITSAAFKELEKTASNFEGDNVKGVTWASADDYRFMATTTAGGEALDNGYGTICIEKAASLDECYNVKAFYRANYDEAKNAVVLSAVATPKAGEPYIYARNNDDPSALVVFSSVGDDEATSPLTSTLVGTFERIYAPKDSYVLQSDNQFHIVGSENKIAVGAHRAYLSVQTSGSEAKLSIIEDDQPTGINGITDNADRDNADAPMYNLSGQRIAAPMSGQIYIVKGKKVVKK